MAIETYDYTNVFREILDGKHEAQVYKESKHSLCIVDKNKKYKTHLLIMPRNSYINFHDMMKNASKEEVIDFYNLIATIIHTTNLVKGYQLYCNTNKSHGQEIMHYHMHLVSYNAA